ncbi:DUF4388 domain-containing protein [candidate division KSB1 bacterium]|nr:DUF4388 domain-containing protein [candidate division KSB1 bacterium]
MTQAEVKGNIQFMSLGTLLSIHCNEHVTLKIVVENDTTTAEIYIDNGNVTHAQIGSEEGESAFNKIIALREGQFSIYPNTRAPRITIEKNWASLFLEGTRLFDEAAAIQNQEIDWNQSDLFDFAPDVNKMPKSAGITNLSNALARVKGIQGITILAKATVLINQQPEALRPEYVQMAQRISTISHKIGSLIGAGEWHYCHVRNTQNFLVLKSAELTLLLTTAREVSLEVLLNEISVLIKRYRVGIGGNDDFTKR